MHPSLKEALKVPFFCSQILGNSLQDKLLHYIMISIKDRIGSERMKKSSNMKQIKQSNKNKMTFQGQIAPSQQGSYFNPYANNSSVQTRISSTYNTHTEIKDIATRKKKNSNNNRVNSNSKKRNKVSELENTTQKKILSQQTPYTNSYRSSYEVRDGQSYSLGHGSTENRQIPQESISPQKRRETLRKSNKLTKAQIQRMKKRRKRRFVLRVAMTMAMTTLGVWGMIQLKDMLEKPKVSYQIVKTGTVDNSISLSGIILRNEQVIYSEDEGTIQYVVSEGEKVKKDGLVYVLVDEQQLAQSTKVQNEVDEQIYQKAEDRKEISYYQDQIYNLNEDVKTNLEMFYDNRYDNTTHFVYTLRGQLDQNINKRTAIYTQEQKEQKQNIADLKTEIEANINQYHLGKTAPQAGIISYKVDGQEVVNVSELLEKIDYEKYNSIIKGSKLNYHNKNTVAKEEPIYKIILDNKWYIISYIDLSEEEDFKEGQSYYLDFTGTTNKQVNFKLISKQNEEDKRIRLVFETNDQISDFLDLRTIDFTIGNKNVTGLKIPKQAIVEQNMLKIPSVYCVEKEGQLGVYRKTGEVTEFVPIKVQYQKEEDSYIRQDIVQANSIQVNNIIVEPETGNTYQVTDIETKQGVYVINGKIAEFKTIEVEMISGEYAIVKYGGNTQLKEMDKMISNPKGIKLEQLLTDMSIQNE